MKESTSSTTIVRDKDVLRDVLRILGSATGGKPVLLHLVSGVDTEGNILVPRGVDFIQPEGSSPNVVAVYHNHILRYRGGPPFVFQSDKATLPVGELKKAGFVILTPNMIEVFNSKTRSSDRILTDPVSMVSPNRVSTTPGSAPFIPSFVGAELVKPSKFLNKLRKAGLLDDGIVLPSPAAWERIMGRVRSTVAQEGASTFAVVRGKWIPFFYHEARYAAPSSGNLGNSCMRNESCQRHLQFYAANPNKVGLAVLFRRDSGGSDMRMKVVARCLVWFMENGSVYSDRIYSMRSHFAQALADSVREKFGDRLRGSVYHCSYIEPRRKVRINIECAETVEGTYPYLDSMKWLDVLNGDISNWPRTGPGVRVIECTNGAWVTPGDDEGDDDDDDWYDPEEENEDE